MHFRGFPFNSRQQRRAAVRHAGGFSLVELLIVIAIIVVLIALLLPAIGMARAKARQAKCSSQLTQIYKGLMQARTKLPQVVLSTDWPGKLRPYLEQETQIYACPDQGSSISASYGMNTRAHRIENEDFGRIVMLDYDVLEVNVVGQKRQTLDGTWPVQAAPRHFQQQNVLFGGGSVEPRSPTAIDPRFCDTYDKFWRPLRDVHMLLENCLPPGATASVSGGAGGGTATSTATTATAGTATAGTTTSGSTTSGSTTTGGSTSTSTTTGGSTTGPSCPPPNSSPAPCYDPDSGFPELADFWIWEANPYPQYCDASCVCNSARREYPLDPMDSGKLLLIPETSTTYRLAYFDGRNPDGSMNFVMRCTRQPDGSIVIQALSAASFSFYSIYTCRLNAGGQPVGTLYRINDTPGHGCMVNQTASASGTVVGMTCIP